MRHEAAARKTLLPFQTHLQVRSDNVAVSSLVARLLRPVACLELSCVYTFTSASVGNRWLGPTGTLTVDGGIEDHLY